MKLAHSIKIKVLFDELEENQEYILDLISQFFPKKINQILDENSQNIKLLEKEKFEIDITKFNKKDALKNNFKNLNLIDASDLTMITITEEKETLINEMIDILKNKLGKESCQEIMNQEDRIDDDCNLFIRLDKETLKLTQSGKCIHFKIKLACYPSKKENAIKLTKQIFQ